MQALGKHKYWISICHSQNGMSNNQIDYIMIKRRFRSGINVASNSVYKHLNFDYKEYIETKFSEELTDNDDINIINW